MTPRLLQNFRGTRALVIATPGSAVDVLESSLEKLGLMVERVTPADGRPVVDLAAVQPETHVLFLDGDLDLSELLQTHPAIARVAPMIGLVGIEAPGRLKALMKAGATAFLRKPIHVGGIYTALFLGINAFARRRALETQLEEHQDRRRRRRSVVKAIVMTMREDQVDDDEAYVRLRRDSMRARLSLESYCEDLVARSNPALDPSRCPAAAAVDRRSS